MKPGDVIDGKYRIEAELGEGGMGRVLAAGHLTLGSTVALKVLKSEALKFPEVPRRFLREARAAGRLRNEHVVRVMDVGQLATGEPYMVMEMLQGIDLSTLLNDGPVPLALALEYIAQACAGLAEAHAMGMVHRDIKPANLFVTQRPNGAPLVKLLDFGIATAATGDVDHKLTSTLTVMGSPSYMSPEQLRAARDVDARSDIWSLGVTLYELLSGEQPFNGPTLTALTLKIVSEPHEPLQNVPLALAAIVDRCLAKERQDRFDNVAELATALAPLFPNGRYHAELVAGTLSQSRDSSVALSGTRRPSSSVPWPPPPTPIPAPASTTTTDLTAGESAPMLQRPHRRRRVAWVMLGAALTGGIVTAGIVLSQRATSSAAPAAEIAPVAAPAPAPVQPSAPVQPPAPVQPSPPPEQAPAPAPPETAPAPPEAPARPPAKPPVRRVPAIRRVPVKPDPRAPIEPPDYTKKEPVKEPVKEPSKEPPKKPCAPNDPTCGL